MADALPACCSIIVVFGGLLAFMSFSQLSPTEMALQYNFVTQSVDKVPLVGAGLYTIGPFNSLIRFPTTINTVEYDASHKDVLDGRTSDGLPLMLGVAFQYRLLPDGVYDLYHKFGLDYEGVFKKVGIHVITEMATQYTAYTFFNEKMRIAADMRVALNEFFAKHFHATVETLQINDDELPPKFLDAVLKSATMKQNVTRMSKMYGARAVEFQTMVLVAEAQANVTVAQAMGDRHKIIQAGRADAAVIDAFTTAEASSYGTISDELGLKGDDLLNYIWYDSLGGGGVGSSEATEKTILVGVNPAAYISQQ